MAEIKYSVIEDAPDEEYWSAYCYKGVLEDIFSVIGPKINADHIYWPMSDGIVLYRCFRYPSGDYERDLDMDEPDDSKAACCIYLWDHWNDPAHENSIMHRLCSWQQAIDRGWLGREYPE